MTGSELLLLALAGAFFYRLRGGAISAIFPSSGTQLARLCWCLPTSLLVGLLADNLLVALATFPVLFLGLMIPHGWAQNDDAIGVLGMSAVSIARVFLLVASVYLVSDNSWWLAIFAAQLSGPTYWLAYRIPSTIPQLSRGCELGEAFTGALIYVGLGLATYGGIAH